MSKNRGETSKQKPEVILPASITLDSESLRAGVRRIQALRSGAESFAREAEVRGGPGSGGPTAQKSADRMREQASGAIDLLGELMPPPEGAVNWLEAIERIEL